MNIETTTGAAMGILAIAAYIDWKDHRVPNWLTLSAWVFGVLFHTLLNGWSGLGASLLGTVVGFSTLIIPYALKGMGAGDVKLMASVGAWVGAAVTWQAFLWIVIIGGAMGVYSILRSREVVDRVSVLLCAGKNMMSMSSLDAGMGASAPKKILLPYGVPIAFGFYAYFLFGGLI
jgi:prepilin peptidase CpaA